MLEGSQRPPQNGPPQKGRSAAGDPPNRFLTVHRAADPDAELDPEDDPSQQRVATQFLPDRSESIVTENDSPDVPFRYSVNPYRGCEHGCSYCYARPSHEYLGLGAGLDFESKIFVKERAPELFARWLARDGWQPEMICFSGITDCYQPAERKFAADARLPAGGGRGATADRHHHQEPARDPRPGRAGADGRASARSRVDSASPRSTSNWHGGWNRAPAVRPRGSRRFASCRGPACPRG